jgi:hypothetical protein
MSRSKIFEIGAILLAIAVTVPLALPMSPLEELARKELKDLIASAKTPADHERLAAHYHSEAQRLEAKSREHEEDLAEYYKNPSRYPSKYPTMGDHCRSLVGYYKMAAERAATLALMHKALADGVH